MTPFVKERRIVVTLDRANVDTDQIIPKQFLKSIRRTGFGETLFFDWKRRADGSPDPDFDRTCRDWDVHRVGFGPLKTCLDDTSSSTHDGRLQQHYYLSWLVVSRDGRAAWKKPKPRYTRGVLAKYASHVSSASLGAVTDSNLAL